MPNRVVVQGNFVRIPRASEYPTPRPVIGDCCPCGPGGPQMCQPQDPTCQTFQTTVVNGGPAGQDFPPLNFCEFVRTTTGPVSGNNFTMGTNSTPCPVGVPACASGNAQRIILRNTPVTPKFRYHYHVTFSGLDQVVLHPPPTAPNNWVFNGFSLPLKAFGYTLDRVVFGHPLVNAAGTVLGIDININSFGFGAGTLFPVGPISVYTLAEFDTVSPGIDVRTWINNTLILDENRPFGAPNRCASSEFQIEHWQLARFGPGQQPDNDTPGINCQCNFHYCGYFDGGDNEPPFLVQEIPDQLNKPGDTVSLDLNQYFDDPDSDPLTYGVLNLPPGLSEANGIISGTVELPEFTYIVQAIATDPFLESASDFFNWEVRENNPPIQTAPIPNQSANEGDTQNFDISQYFEDPDGDPLLFSNPNNTLAPLGLTLDANTGIISGTIADDTGQPSGNNYVITIRVEDVPFGESISTTFDWFVNN